LAWSNDNWRVRWSTKYIGKFTDSQSRAENYQDYLAANDERCVAGDATCVENPESLMFHHYGS
jgi:iron complex outermembrane receptor protein